MDTRNCVVKDVPAKHMKSLSGHLHAYKFRDDLGEAGDESINFSGEKKVVDTLQDVARTLVGDTSVQVLDGECPTNLYPTAIKMYKNTKTHEHADYDTSKFNTQRAVFTMYIVMDANRPIDFRINFGTLGYEAYKLTKGKALYFPAHCIHEVVQPDGGTRTALVYHFTTDRLSRYAPDKRTPRKLAKLRRLPRHKYC